jgi:hypothetical protein
MHSSLYPALLAAAMIALVTSPVSAAPKSHVKEKGSFTLTATLTATAAAPVGTTGNAEIEVTKEKFKSEATAELSLTTTGLAAGNYSVDATLTDATTAHLGDFVVDGTVPPPATPEPIVFALPATVDVASIASLSVSDAAAAVMLEGELAVGTINWKFIANVRVSGPEVLATDGPKPKKVRGHAVSHSFIKDSVETKRDFLWVAFGAPGETELTINVDGVAVGTVLSTKQGKVEFHEIAETVVLRDMKLITLTDALGAIVMQADFQP